MGTISTPNLVYEYDLSHCRSQFSLLKFSYCILIVQGLFGFLTLLAAYVMLGKVTTPIIAVESLFIAACGTYAFYVFPHVVWRSRYRTDVLVLFIAILALTAQIFSLGELIAQFEDAMASRGYSSALQNIDDNLHTQIVLEIVYGLVLLMGFLALLLLARKEIHSRKLIDLLDIAHTERSKHTAALGIKGKSIDLSKAISYLVAAVALWVVAQFISSASAYGVVFSLLQIPLILFVLLLLLRSRQFFQISAESLLDHDKRDPILFLRAFMDDIKPTTSAIGHPLGFARLLDFSFETRLANYFMGFGPFIAVASPRDKMPQLGASRLKLRDDNWHVFVERMIRDSQLIIMLAGATEWVDWELETIIKSENVTKLLLLLPRPPSVGFRKELPSITNRKTLERFVHIRAAFVHTIWENALEEVTTPEHLLGFVMHPDGTLSAVKSKSWDNDVIDSAAELLYLRMHNLMPV